MSSVNESVAIEQDPPYPGNALPDTPLPQIHRCVLVCQHRTCLRHGAAAVMGAFAQVTIPRVTIQVSECLGQCSIGPNARVLPDDVWYARLTPEDVAIIADQHLQGGQPVDRLLNPRIHLRF